MAKNKIKLQSHKYLTYFSYYIDVATQLLKAVQVSNEITNNGSVDEIN